MISWSSIIYGAGLSAVLAAALGAAVARGNRPRVALTCAVGAAVGPIAWNAILHATNAGQFFHDAPIAIMPASWQDTGPASLPLPRPVSLRASARSGT